MRDAEEVPERCLGEMRDVDDDAEPLELSHDARSRAGEPARGGHADTVGEVVRAVPGELDRAQPELVVGVQRRDCPCRPASEHGREPLEVEDERELIARAGLVEVRAVVTIRSAGQRVDLGAGVFDHEARTRRGVAAAVVAARHVAADRKELDVARRPPAGAGGSRRRGALLARRPPPPHVDRDVRVAFDYRVRAVEPSEPPRGDPVRSWLRRYSSGW